MISLIIPASYQISLIQQQLTDELGTAKNIKSKQNRDSVVDAIRSVQERLKLFGNKAPENGLCIFCGKVETDAANQKMINHQIIPHKPIYKKLYMCDDHFHVDTIADMYMQSDMFGFIIVDGSGALYASVSNTEIDVKYEFTVDLPKKHNKGGQSAVRFERLREIAVDNYIRKVCENASSVLLGDSNQVSVKGIIVAGAAEIKSRFMNSNLLDPRIKAKICGVYDVQYGGRTGLNAAIEQAKDLLSSLALMKEKKIINEFFEHLNKDTGKYIFGITETMNQLVSGTIEKLIMYQDLKTHRTESEDGTISYSADESPASVPLTDWLIENYTNFGTKLHLISDQTEEGNQLIKGFGGLAGILRYVVHNVTVDDDIIDDEQCDL